MNVHQNNLPTPERGVQILLRRIEAILAYVLLGYTALWTLVVFHMIGFQIANPSASDTLSAAGNLVYVLLLTSVVGVALLRKSASFKGWWRTAIAGALVVFSLLVAYDCLAHLVPSNLLPTLAQIAPGPIEIWHTTGPLIIGFLAGSFILVYSLHVLRESRMSERGPDA